jgi:hypothetical protein
MSQNPPVLPQVFQTLAHLMTSGYALLFSLCLSFSPCSTHAYSPTLCQGVTSSRRLLGFPTFPHSTHQISTPHFS